MMRGVLVAILIALLAAGGPGAAGAGPAVSGTFTLYTSESEDDINLLVGDFKRRHPGVDVKIFRAGSGPVVAKLQAELQGGRIQADVIWFADIAFFQDLARRDLLLAYAPPTGRRADPKLHYDGNRYHEVRLIFNVVAFNTNHVRFRPTSWWDLTLPRYRGRAGMPNPFVSGAAFAHVGTFASMREFGWDYYRKLKENDARILRANGDVLRALAAGEISIAQIVDFFVRAAKAQGSPVDHIWPQEGAVLVPTPIAIIKGTPNEAAAKAFLDYLYTPEAQRLFVQRAYVPVIPGIPLPQGAPDPSDLKLIQTNLGYIDRHREEIKRTFSELFGIQ
ncbi:MAG: ABC transporter substrate-binding protein [Armatimonadota bacterium]|nr:ABC transporter substrate-binding protein [Armatimonadota bacterium]